MRVANSQTTVVSVQTQAGGVLEVILEGPSHADVQGPAARKLAEQAACEAGIPKVAHLDNDAFAIDTEGKEIRPETQQQQVFGGVRCAYRMRASIS